MSAQLHSYHVMPHAVGSIPESHFVFHSDDADHLADFLTRGQEPVREHSA